MIGLEPLSVHSGRLSLCETSAHLHQGRWSPSPVPETLLGLNKFNTHVPSPSMHMSYSLRDVLKVASQTTKARRRSCHMALTGKLQSSKLNRTLQPSVAGHSATIVPALSATESPPSCLLAVEQASSCAALVATQACKARQHEHVLVIELSGRRSGAAQHHQRCISSARAAGSRQPPLDTPVPALAPTSFGGLQRSSHVFWIGSFTSSQSGWTIFRPRAQKNRQQTAQEELEATSVVISV